MIASEVTHARRYYPDEQGRWYISFAGCNCHHEANQYSNRGSYVEPHLDKINGGECCVLCLRVWKLGPYRLAKALILADLWRTRESKYGFPIVQCEPPGAVDPIAVIDAASYVPRRTVGA